VSGLPRGVASARELKDGERLRAAVIIVGSGAGGGVLAAELAEAGVDVLVLEEGGFARSEEFVPEASEAIRTLYRDGGASMTIGNPPVIFSEGRTVGGSTVINGGMSWRTPEPILERWRKDDGVHAITPESMAPYFDRVEAFINAAHQDPESMSRDNELLKEAADRKGWAVVPNIRNQVHCAGTNNCAFGCSSGAKRSVLVTYVPRALAFGARIVTDLRAQAVEFDGTTARRVRCHVAGRPGVTVWAEAPVIVLACGAIQTPALLLRSGFRSKSGRVGTDLSLHPNTKVQAVMKEDIYAWKGVHQAYQVREFQERGVVFAAVNIPPALLAMTAPAYGPALFELMQDYHKVLNAGLLLEDTTTGRVRLGPGGIPLTFYALSDHDAERLVEATTILCELLFEAGAQRIAAPFDGFPDLHGPDDIAKLRKQTVPKSALDLFTVHMMGTARMGDDPKRHVCDSYGKVWGADGLWVSDASLFPSPIGVNPMETIMALSTRNAERLLETRPWAVGARPAPKRRFGVFGARPA
jgi:choline dehydrogenase-like flavoprotein